MISDALRPKTFSGLFSAAPSVALASLALTAAMMSSTKAAQSAVTMVAGGAGLVAFCGAATLLEQKLGSIATSALAWVSWGLVSGVVFWLFFA